MRIVIDLDILVDPTGQALRPGIDRFLAGLRDLGHELVLWTSRPEQEGRAIQRRHDLTGFVREVYLEDYDPACRRQLKDIRKVGAQAILDDDGAEIRFAESSGRYGRQIAVWRPERGETEDFEAILATFRPRGGVVDWMKGLLALA